MTSIVIREQTIEPLVAIKMKCMIWTWGSTVVVDQHVYMNDFGLLATLWRNSIRRRATVLLSLCLHSCDFSLTYKLFLRHTSVHNVHYITASACDIIWTAHKPHLSVEPSKQRHKNRFCMGKESPTDHDGGQKTTASFELTVIVAIRAETRTTI